MKLRLAGKAETVFRIIERLAHPARMERRCADKQGFPKEVA